MINQLKRVALANDVNLHLVNSDKFKTVLFGVYIQRPLCQEEASMNAMISRIIEKSNRKYDSPRKMSEALDQLYGSVLVSDVHKYGERQLIQVKMQMASDRIVEDPDFLDEGVALLNEVIHHPTIINGGFDPELFEMERKHLMDELKMRVEDKAGWALDLCIEQLCAGEPYAIHEFGSEDTLKSLTPQVTWAHYQKVLKTSPMDIVVIGNFDTDAMYNRILNHFECSDSEKIKVPREVVLFSNQRVQRYEEFHDIKQGRLAMGYRMNVTYESSEYVPALLASMILGNGASSKLFKEVREKEGLCYSIFARADKYKSVMLIYAGVDTENFDKAEALIIKTVEDIQRGLVTEKELEIAKTNLISMFSSMSDFPNSYINFYFGQYLTGGTVAIEAYQALLDGITTEDVVVAAQKFELGQVVRLNREQVNHESR